MREPGRWSRFRVALFLVPLFLFLVYPVGFWPFDIGANERAHAYLALALYTRGEVSVDEEVFLYFPNQDLIFRGGRFYSNKPPGPALWLLPPAALVDCFAPGPPELVPLLYWGRVLMLTLPFVLFLYALGRALERLCAPPLAWGLVLAYALGTNAGVYAVLYFGHDLAAMAQGTAFLLLWRRRRPALAGACAGFGVLCEYQTVVIAVLLGAWALVQGRRAAMAFAAGALPPLVLFLLYNLAVTGAPGETPYGEHFREYEIPAAGRLGFEGPRWEKLWGLTLSPALGLFFHSPWLLLLLPAAAWACLSRPPEAGAIRLALAACAALFLVVLCHRFWVGDAIAGPRYLTASLPFTLPPLAVFLARLRGRARFAAHLGLLVGAAVGIFTFTLLLVTRPYVPTSADALTQNPLGSLAWPLLKEGRLTLTVVQVLGGGNAAAAAGFACLFGAVLGGYAVSAIRTLGAPQRWHGLLALALALLACWFWLSVGRSDSPRLRRERGILGQLMDLRLQPRAGRRLRFPRRPRALPPRPVRLRVRPHTRDLFRVLPYGSPLELVAEDLRLAQGALWHREEGLLVSDVHNNVIFRLRVGAALTTFLPHSGFHGHEAALLPAPGANGLARDPAGRLLLAEQGRRRVTRLEGDGRRTVLAERFHGRRLNRPMALACARDGTVYFTDPPVGLTGKLPLLRPELPFAGVYRVRGGKLELLCATLRVPTGIALGPREERLYVATWWGGKSRVYVFDLARDGQVRGPRLFASLEARPTPTPVPGLAVDREGHVYVCAGRGLWILAPSGQPLGHLEGPLLFQGLAFGGEDGKTLYLTAGRAVYRLRLAVPGR